MMAERMNVLAIALLLAASGLLVVACGDGGADSQTPEITLDDAELREFLGSLLLKREDVPGAIEDPLPEQWETDPESGTGEPLSGFDVSEAGWLGTLGRPVIARAPEGRTFAVGNTAMAFSTASGAAATLAFLHDIDAREMADRFAATTLATSYEVSDLKIDVGEDAWTLLVSGQAELEGAEERLNIAMVVFQRGPLLAWLSTSGYVAFDEDLFRELARKLDARIVAGLEEL